MKRKIPSSGWIPVLILLLCVSIGLNLVLMRQLSKASVVTEVYDGDSFELEDGRRVRLLGVDAPEADRCMGPEAKESLTRMIAGKQVQVKNGTIDDYGRIVGNVFFRGNFINASLVRSGLAKNLSAGSPYKKLVDEASEFAKSSELGIYSAQCRNASHRPGCDIKGNIRQGKRYYFTPGCKPYGNVIVDGSFGDEWFCSVEDAVTQGFVQAPTCLTH